MKKKLWVLQCIVLLCAVATVVIPAGAESIKSLPSSSLPAKSEWKKMRPASFEATNESAYKQCLRTAGLSDGDALNYEKCLILKDKLEHAERYPVDEQCHWTLVPDDIVFNYMNGITNGRSGVKQLVKKKLGREDKAQLCSLGHGWYSYFFRGDAGKSCNNVGFVYVMPTPPTPPVKEVIKYHKVLFSDPVHSGTYQHLDALLIENCCGRDIFIPSYNFYLEDNSLKSTGYTEQRD
jgi:hypothetical protein